MNDRQRVAVVTGGGGGIGAAIAESLGRTGTFVVTVDPLVSVDGGRQWGSLSELTVAETDGTRRAAQPADVTHVRWAFDKPVPAGGTGKLLFRGVVK